MRKIFALIMIASIILLSGCNHSANVEIPEDVRTSSEYDMTEGSTEAQTETASIEANSNSTESATDDNETTDQTDRDEGIETESTGEESTENTEAETNESTEGNDEESTEDVTPTEDDHESPSHAHEYTEKVTNPTCTNGGYTTYTCDCGDTYKGNETSATGHSFGDWVTTKEPTENATGISERVCKNCNVKESKTLDKIVPNHTHKYASTTTKKATCTEEGVLTYTCSCGSSYAEKIAKTNHNYTDNKVAATCTTAGYTSHTCKTCGYNYKDGNVVATGHNYNNTVTAPTCTEQGYTTHTCKTCGNTYKDTYVNAKGHSWSDWATTKEPTTTSTGTATRKCSVCGKTDTKTLDKLVENHKHSYTASITKKATCTENGIRTFACSCGDYYTEHINKTGHSYTSSVVRATCTAKGYTKFVCGNCGDNYTTNEVAATGHSYQFTSDTATCSAAGVKTETCSKCGNTKTSASVAKGCTNTRIEEKQASCGESGYKKVICNTCGKTLSETTISGESHTWEEVEICEAMDKMIADLEANGEYYDGSYHYYNYETWMVNRCTKCGYFNPDEMYYPHSDYEVAQIMLGYVNDLRREVLGEGYDLQLDQTLIEICKIRAQEITVVFEHDFTVVNKKHLNAVGENIQHGGTYVLCEIFNNWVESPGHYKNMLVKEWKYLGFAFIDASNNPGHPHVYAVQLFWGGDYGY